MPTLMQGCKQFNGLYKICFVAFYDQELEPMDKELGLQPMWKAPEVMNTGQCFPPLTCAHGVILWRRQGQYSFNRESPLMPSKQDTPVFTYHTRVSVTPEQDQILREYAILFGHVERSLFADIE
jgi:hypothetical protein